MVLMTPGSLTTRRPFMELTLTFVVLLQEFRYVFTEPSFATFRALMTGWCLSPRRRFVTELILSSGSVHDGHHRCYPRFFSQACWDLDLLWRLLARTLPTTFAPRGPVELSAAAPL